jgi:sigma-B regulation protein RsbU (phosphoserine phosphatase)
MKKMSDALIVDVSQDWETACHVQQRFMHHVPPAANGIRYSARCRQLRALGGDCYDFWLFPHNHLAFTIADASGKSLPAALMIASVQSSLRTAAFFAGNEPAVVLGAVNRQLHASTLADRFATLFYGVFDAATHTLRYANAGHHPPMVIRREGSISWLDRSGSPLGVLPNSIYEEGALHLCSGDTVIAYTDGVIETINPSGEEWGVEGITKVAAESKAHHPDELVDAIFMSLDEFSLGRQTDDATVAVLLVE